mmetsp:Transcript_66573/g.192226  ORF Transcript_66573/g.192226 Transcript_66573/m.192226 type:complete len:418 (-) Transcript_66573:102-1355(-)|eukprot:CAMPEP_0176052424 /NCGR_PEP_ID=MMETSP0120_2-20121206/26065_1 /TAXON_ID=160619 /ORGANISM="Kryptoperidinium foliaceum, Strain CCMP 1326" /LENGTH=417 /DNA_ID=CAMNT_0017385863 /DNA_START=52 /DNA_END=1305 /DNA_ORIENTATION=-
MANAPSDNVFIGDLPVGITQEEVQNIFSAYGTVVQCRVIEPKQPGHSACALVRFKDVDEASWVVENLNGNIAETMAEPIVVRFANSSGKGGSGKGAGVQGGCGGKGGGGKAGSGSWDGWSAGSSSSWQQRPKPQSNTPSDNVFIGDLPEALSQEELSSIFSAYGTVVQCRMIPAKVPGTKACGLVRYQSVEEAQWVVDNLNMNIAEGLEEPIVVRFANGPGGEKGGSDGGGKGYGKSGGKTGGYRSEPYSSAKGGKMALSSGKSAGKGGSWGGYGKSADGGKGKSGAAGSMWDVIGTMKKSGLLGPPTVPDEHQVYVRNLPADCTDLDLYRIFAPFGAIAPSGVKAMLHEDGTCKGFGFVDYVDASSATIAMQTLDSYEMPGGGQLQCSIKQARAKGEKGEKGEKGKGEKGKGKGKW